MASVVKFDKAEYEMWQISENLDRAELTKLQRDEHIARWIALKEKAAEVSVQVALDGLEWLW
jgi:hypothetical protein